MHAVCKKCGEMLILKSRTIGPSVRLLHEDKPLTYTCDKCKSMKNIKIIMTVGLPASGKSTWAHQMQKDNPGKFKLVSKDDLRLLLDSGVWSSKNEDFLLEIRDSIIIKSLQEGYDVIVHDTNFGDKHFRDINIIASLMSSDDKRNVTVETKDFTDAPVQECIKRDALRGDKSVGKKVIIQMYDKYVKKEVVLEQDKNAPKAVCVDIDGSLSDSKGRRGFYDWNKVHLDDCNEYLANVIRLMSKTYKVIVLSGRDGSCYDLTKKWLEDNNIPFDMLLMRKVGDMRPDDIVKEEIFDEFILGKYYVESIFDDRMKVTRMWRRKGLNVFQLGDPEIEF